MSDTKPRPKRRCAYCGKRLTGKLRQASKGKAGRYYCDEGCGPKRGGRAR